LDLKLGVHDSAAGAKTDKSFDVEQLAFRDKVRSSRTGIVYGLIRRDLRMSSSAGLYDPCSGRWKVDRR
jgi:hypothetical protein